MSSVMRSGARATSAVAAFLLVILSLGVAGAAYADPGGGNGNDGTSPGNGNAYGADNGNGSGTGSANGADNGAGAQSSGATTEPAAAAGPSSASDSSTKSSSAKSSSAKGSSGQVASAKGSGKGSAKGASGSGTAAGHKTKGTAATVGDVGKPQPLSGADKNSGGANGQCSTAPTGVYCSTRDGSASGNGNGGGKAVGKPCAGCVGKADNKNPHGQMPGPQDHNNGYECDGNNGIAKTNPAHTGCKPGTPPCVGAGCNPPPPPPLCVGAGCNPPPPVCVGAGCNPPPPVVCPEGAVLVDGVCVFGEEEILCPDGSVMPANGKCEEARPPTVLGEEAFRPPVKVKAAAAGVLPATGSSSGLGLLAGFGFTLLALGAGVMMRRRTA